MASPAVGIPRSWIAALLRELGRRPYWSSRRHSLRDVVVRVLRRRWPSTPLPPKSQLPLAEYVYCYGPLDPDNPNSASDWHWAPRKDYFDRSANATLEYYAPMSSSASVNELPRSRGSSISERRAGSASGPPRDTSGAPALDANELENRLKQCEQDDKLFSVADTMISCAEAAAPGFYSPPVPPASAPNGLLAFAVNMPYPSEYNSPSRLAIPARRTPLKSILKTPKTPAPAPLPVSPPSPVLLTPAYPPLILSPQMPVQIPNLPPPLIPLAQSPPLHFIPPLPLPHFAHTGPASLISSSRSSPAVEHPIIPPFPAYHTAPFPCPSPPHAVRSPPAPVFDPRPPSTPFAPSPPSHTASSPSPPHPVRPPRHYPPGYARGVSALLSAPGELLFSFRHPHALMRRRLNMTRHVAVPLSDPILQESAFYPAECAVLLVMPQLPWAVSLSARDGEAGYLTVADVLGGLREHLGARVRPAEREMLRGAGRANLRGDALGDRSWLLGVWEDADAVRRVMGSRRGQNDLVRGRRCFVVLFGSGDETMC